jgi:DNA-binding transcriptional regulator YiaG
LDPTLAYQSRNCTICNLRFVIENFQEEQMNRGSKYYPLFEHLQGSGRDEITLTFAEIEALLGLDLPPSARSRRAWWSNRSKEALQASAWMEAGYHVEDLDLEREQATFRKPLRVYKVARKGDTVLWNGDLIKALRFHMGLSQARLAEELGVRQQTVSEWETGAYAPGRAMSKYLSLVAERADFKYGEEK